MQDRLPQGDPPFLNQLLEFHASDLLPPDNVVHQPIMFLHERFQTVSATCLCTCKTCNSFEVATRYNSHSGTSFQGMELGSPIILLEGAAICLQLPVNLELTSSNF